MNVSLVPSLESAPPAAVYQQRLDQECSAVVERGILVQSSFNTVCAIEYMKSHNVSPQVIERVLLRPDQRRKITH
ncbi:hypothetical protein [Duganella callida]|uniref:Uncharacterized protein n=1 Tax=Duganella callida TaxID=2561932 RepID=A0A4Y9SX75_9BURK|nr:hypothetical protein [Duganella callida]TFW31293.1 hypothetical protein E4L98_00570 [Duganella callida]